jgi:hypothetical protein
MVIYVSCHSLGRFSASPQARTDAAAMQVLLQVRPCQTRTILSWHSADQQYCKAFHLGVHPSLCDDGAQQINRRIEDVIFNQWF